MKTENKLTVVTFAVSLVTFTNKNNNTMLHSDLLCSYEYDELVSNIKNDMCKKHGLMASDIEIKTELTKSFTFKTVIASELSYVMDYHK